MLQMLNIKNDTIYHIKCIIIGNINVGKSTLIKKIITNNFYHDYTSTLGVDYFTIKKEYNGKNFIIQFWDTAGQERFNSIINSFYKNITICYVMYDVTDLDSFIKISKWIEDFIYNTNNSDTIIVLIGNKIDQESKRVITIDQGKKLASKYNIMFMEISCNNINLIDSKINNNIDIILSKPIDKLIQLIELKQIIPSTNNGIRILNESNSNPNLIPNLIPNSDNKYTSKCNCY